MEIKHYTAVKNLNSSPVLFDSILYFGSEDGYLYAMAIFEYIKKAFSDIRLSGTAENFGTRSKNDPEIETTITISNYSYLTDSIYIRFDNSEDFQDEAVKINLNNFLLSPLSLKTLRITLDPSKLNIGHNSIKLTLVSKHNDIKELDLFFVLRIEELLSVKFHETQNKNNLNNLLNYPNPFTEFTAFYYELDKEDYVELNICDISGRIVKTLVNNKQNNGTKIVRWDGNDENGNSLQAGIYIYKLQIGKKYNTGKFYWNNPLDHIDYLVARA